MASIKVCLKKCFPPQPLDVQYTDVIEKPMRLRVFDLKTKFITSDKTLIRRLRGIVAYVVKSKVQILLAFSLVFNLFNFATIGNVFYTTQNFLKNV